MIPLGICQCGCGGLTRIPNYNDKNTNTIKDIPRRFIHGHNPTHGGYTKHGHNRIGTRSPTYRTWDHMIQRCTNPNNDNYYKYGAKGIKICRRWFIFGNFLKDMGIRPTGKELHRVNGAKEYNKKNCIWIQKSEHSRISALVRYKGEMDEKNSGPLGSSYTISY